jgi:hypothetical protein
MPCQGVWSISISQMNTFDRSICYSAHPNLISSQRLEITRRLQAVPPKTEARASSTEFFKRSFRATILA